MEAQHRNVLLLRWRAAPSLLTQKQELCFDQTASDGERVHRVYSSKAGRDSVWEIELQSHGFVLSKPLSAHLSALSVFDPE